MKCCDEFFSIVQRIDGEVVSYLTVTALIILV